MTRRRSYTQPRLYDEPCNACPGEHGEHEPWCPNFMRGAAPGGDPSEWTPLFTPRDDNQPKEEAA